MFFKKSQKTKEAVTKRGIKKMDAMITGAILGGVVASLYGVKKMKDAQENKTETQLQIPQIEEKSPGFFAKIFNRK